ncbi:MAG: ATP-binding protein [Terracidiphilus sp.]|jgi:nitrogen fixation/metabolism regulation signal transduction histidine kinase
MVSESIAPRRGSSIRRVRWQCLLLALPAVVLAVILLVRERFPLVAGVLLAGCLLLYLVLVAFALIDGIVRPLQTLANVVASLRKGDYAFRARGAGSHDALSELAAEINVLAGLLEQQHVRSLEATALLARISEVMHTPMFAFDRNGQLRLVNGAGARLLGISQAQCLARAAHDLILQGVGMEELLAAPDQSIHTIAADKSSSAATRWLLRKAAFRQEGAPHTLLLLADVSVPLQEEEQTAWKRLIRVLGHELSNSLAPIKSIAGSLLARVDEKDEGDLGRDLRQGLRVIESRAEALHHFVQSYRRLAQLPPPRRRLVDLGPLLERVSLLERRLSVEIVPGPPVALDVDSDQLEQMFINLLANAVDASLESGAEQVRMNWRLTGGAVWVAIEDQGPGIANADNLFVPFYTTKPTGSGVGLVLAQQIARAHGGAIQLVNRDDRTGAIALVRLPLISAENPQNEPVETC